MLPGKNPRPTATEPEADVIMKPLLLWLVTASAALLTACHPNQGVTAKPESNPNVNAPMNETTPTELATLGGGCFWCTEAVFQMLPGVKSVVSGYAGGHTKNPTYQDISRGDTGHAEVIQVAFNPEQISYETILENFWEAHDPTTLNRQGNDVGPQYRSIILYHSETQKLAAEKSKAAAQADFLSPIVTEIVPLETFYPGEEYHQNYYRNNPDQAYCRIVIRPKIEKFEKKLQGK
jgi:peptide-methionine (S)-S-oxide reductase